MLRCDPLHYLSRLSKLDHTNIVKIMDTRNACRTLYCIPSGFVAIIYKGALFRMALSKVVLVKGKGVLNQNNAIDQRKLLQMYSKGLELLFNSKSPQEGMQHLFKSSDKVGIKINTIGGKKISTRPEVSHSLSNLLVGSGILEKRLPILRWEIKSGLYPPQGSCVSVP